MAPANPPTHEPADHPAPTTGPASRIWFHLDDVIPLAVHAASSPRHGLTVAQLLAQAPLLPALIWEASLNGDLLSSNGQPGWFDDRGDPHAARGRTWVDPVYGEIATAFDETGYLPLRGLPGSNFHVIDWLQQAAAGGAHWLSIDITRRRPVIAPHQLDVRDQRGDLYPPDATWAEATVACVPQTGRYPAMVADGYHSCHGGVLARFDRATIAQMMTDMDRARTADGYQPGSHAVLRWSADRIEVHAENIDGITGPRRYDVIGPDPDGLYPFGAYLWPWQRLDNR